MPQPATLTVVHCHGCGTQEPPIFLHHGALWCAECLGKEDLDLYARCQLTKRRSEALRQKTRAIRAEFAARREMQGQLPPAKAWGLAPGEQHEPSQGSNPRHVDINHG
jgi:hypothetical protein